MTLSHGSHPGHPFELLAAAPCGRACSVCKAAADDSDVRWFGCLAAPCNFLLCEKCFNVKEELLAEPQVMIRDPMLDYYDTTAAIRTRPRVNSYCLSMLYGGRLMQVLSTAVDEADPTQVYFRIASGGWIKKSDVVCVHPTGNPNMQLLTDLHLKGIKLGDSIASGAVDFDVLTRLLAETMDVIDSNACYGVVMSAMVMYPLLTTVDIPLRHFRVAPDPWPIANYAHFVLHFVLSKLVERMDLEEAQCDCRLADSTMMPLYGEVLARCLYVTYGLTFNWMVHLPPSFVHLISRALATMDRLRMLLREEPLDQQPVLTAPAVTTQHSNAEIERQRLARLFLFMTDLGGKVLQQCIKDPRLDLDVLQPIRDQLCMSGAQGLSKVFCEALATLAEVDLLRVQRSFLQIDALEVVGSLAATATLADSQVAVYRLVRCLAKHCPQNIALVGTVLLDHLLAMLARTQSPAVYVAAMECFYELAFNDPRYQGTEAEGAEAPQPQLRACSALCSVADGNHRGAPDGPVATPFQLLHTYRLPHGLLAPLCAFCAAHHPPAAGDLAERPQYARFTCQCTHCGGGGAESSRMAARPAPLPSVPLTLALQKLVAHLPEQVLKLTDSMRFPQALNALGRVLLRVAPTDEVLVRMVDELARYSALDQLPHAALVIKANMHRPLVRQRLSNCRDTELGRYVCGAFEVVTPAKNFVDETPAKSQQGSELGLSASPYASSTMQSGSVYEMRGGLSSYVRGSTRGVQLFGTGASVEE